MSRLCLVLACTALCACTNDGPGRDDGPPGGGGRTPRALPNVFISPAGEPFRAAAGAPYPAAAWFAGADANHDGRLTREEFRADALRFFARLDKNHDGVIDGQEVGDYEQNVAPEILPRIEALHADEGMDTSLTFGDSNNDDTGRSTHRSAASRQPSPPRGIGLQGAAVYGLVNAPEPVTAADLSFDGRITRAEFLQVIDQRFDALDKDGRGYLILETLPKTPIQAEILRRARKARGRRLAEHPPEAPSAETGVP